MKTTIELSDALLAAAKTQAAREGTSVRALVEEGLRHVIGERKRRAHFRFVPPTFKGEGLDPQLSGGSWDEIRDLVYQGRGS